MKITIFVKKYYHGVERKMGMDYRGLSGIGRSIALEFSYHNSNLVLLSRNMEELEENSFIL
jgi:hypothetical protein